MIRATRWPPGSTSPSSRRWSRRSARTGARSRKSSQPRLLEECYKILRAGSAARAFRVLSDIGLLEPTSSELHKGATDALWRSPSTDAYAAVSTRRRTR
jgi:tRNA nucleotidyltransferase/poly(A) polymerase